MSKTYPNPPALFPSQHYGFSQGVATLRKTTVSVSGQVGWNLSDRSPPISGFKPVKLWKTSRL
jgi:hypothetical protein